MLSEQCKFINHTSYDDVFAHSHVKRYHTENTSGIQQNLAEHCFRVTLLAVKFLYEYQKLGLETHPNFIDSTYEIHDLELEIFRYAMLHEASELDSGDVPSHVKWYLRENHGIDINKIVEDQHWSKRLLEGVANIRRVHPVTKALVSLADTIEGIIFARSTIPNGGVKEAVLEDWNKIWGKKLILFKDDINAHFLNFLTKERFHNPDFIDPANR